MPRKRNYLGEKADLERLTKKNQRDYGKVAKMRLSALSKTLGTRVQMINMSSPEFREYDKSLSKNIKSTKQRLETAESSVKALIDDLTNRQNLNFPVDNSNQLMPEWVSTDNIVNRLNEVFEAIQDKTDDDKQDKQKQEEGNDNG